MPEQTDLKVRQHKCGHTTPGPAPEASEQETCPACLVEENKLT